MVMVSPPEHTQRRLDTMLRELNALRVECGLPPFDASSCPDDVQRAVSEIRQAIRVQTQRLVEQLEVTNGLLRTLIEQTRDR